MSLRLALDWRQAERKKAYDAYYAATSKFYGERISDADVIETQYEKDVAPFRARRDLALKVSEEKYQATTAPARAELKTRLAEIESETRKKSRNER